MEFTWNAYKELIQMLKEYGYVFTDYHKYRKIPKSVILRHDIDMDIAKAVEMASLEYELGVKATYFVLVSSDFYNIFSAENEKKLRLILEMGHEIGLHFDEVKYLSEDEMLQGIDTEISLLEKCIGTKVKSVSMHRPSQKTLKANYTIRGGDVANSYSDEFFGKFKYVSDSRRCWREDVLEIVKSNAFSRLHILTHPIWYFETEVSIGETIGAFIRRANHERYEHVRCNIRDVEDIVKEEEI